MYFLINVGIVSVSVNSFIICYFLINSWLQWKSRIW